MKLAFLFLALCIAYCAGESCTISPIIPIQHACRHTFCDNSTTGWYTVCHRLPGSFTNGVCLCSHDENAGHSCKVQSDCTGDCPTSIHQWHCVDEACQCGAFSLG